MVQFYFSKSSSIIGASEVIAPEISRDRARFFGQRTEGAPSYRRHDFSVYASLLLACMFFIDPIGFFLTNIQFLSRTNFHFSRICSIWYGALE